MRLFKTLAAELETQEKETLSTLKRIKEEKS